ncbi:MAG: hypothetical protein J6J81_07205, partial [Oscillospiraceae bacterium]|nr:hypothetical protein [Oscillospiraceae bacterium]
MQHLFFPGRKSSGTIGLQRKNKGGGSYGPGIDRVFSRADENYFSGVLRRVKVGNTEIAAQLLRELTGADLFKIEPVQ